VQRVKTGRRESIRESVVASERPLILRQIRKTERIFRGNQQKETKSRRGTGGDVDLVLKAPSKDNTIREAGARSGPRPEKKNGGGTINHFY